MNPQEEIIEGIRQQGRQKRGMTHLINYLKGKELTQKEAIWAYCYQCNGYGELENCEADTCPLYPFAPYTSKRRLARKKKESVTAPTYLTAFQIAFQGVRKGFVRVCDKHGKADMGRRSESLGKYNFTTAPVLVHEFSQFNLFGEVEGDRNRANHQKFILITE